MDHLIRTESNDVWYCDFMIRAKAYPDLFLEVQVGDQPGKFRKPEAYLTDIIAYSYKPSRTVYIFSYRHTCLLIESYYHHLTQQFPLKTAASTDPQGHRWTTTGIIVPADYLASILGKPAFREIRLP